MPNLGRGISMAILVLGMTLSMAVFVLGMTLAGYFAGKAVHPDGAPVCRCCKCDQPCCCEQPAKPAKCCEPKPNEPKELKPLDGPDSIELADTVTLVLPDGSKLDGTVIKVEPAKPDPPKSMIAIEAEIKRMRDNALKAKPLPKE